MERLMKNEKENEKNLGHAILVAEDEEGHYEPVGLAATIAEAKYLAAEDFRHRLLALEADRDPGLCPYQYKLFARGFGGKLAVVATFPASEF
jgi:hypothetical protein